MNVANASISSRAAYLGFVPVFAVSGIGALDRSVMVAVLGTALTACAVAYWRRVREFTDAAPVHIPVAGLWLLVVTFGVARSGLLLWSTAAEGLRPIQDYLIYAAIGATVATTEEIVFRGGLLAGLTRRLAPRLANAVQAVLFAIVHLATTQWYYMPVLFVDGLLLGAITLATGKLRYAIAGHALLNVIARVPARRASIIEDWVGIAYISTSLLVAAGLLALFWRFNSARVTKSEESV